MRERRITRRRKTPQETDAGASGLILGENTPFAITEEYKMLRTAVSFAASVGGDGCKIIGITSPLPSEGKSVTCMNLAIAFAMTKARVLLMDCDMRRPVIARTMRVTPAPGMSNTLAGISGWRNAVQKIERGGAGIDIIPSGDIPPNPPELLGSARAGEIFKETAKEYDYIFVDLPPVMLVSDAAALSKQLTGAVMVVRAGRTKREDVKRALERLELAGTNILGFVLNGAGRAEGRRYYDYGYGYGEQRETGG